MHKELNEELNTLFEELGYVYIPEGCCQGKGRTDGKECCGGPQCGSNDEE